VKPVEEQSHYDVLEVPVTAGRDEIERAYPLVRAAYEPGALASYSVFGRDEVAEICDRIDEAYQVLRDVEARERYDALLGIDAGFPSFQEPMEPIPAPMSSGATGASALDDLEEIEDEDEGNWDGSKLRRARMRRGIEISAIAETTKINPNYLRAIEEEAYADLPAAVYTRGFITAYAKTIEIDPAPVLQDFMENFKEARSERRRGSLLSGRR